MRRYISFALVTNVRSNVTSEGGPNTNQSLDFFFCVFNTWQKKKGTQGLIEIENPNLVKQKNVKAKDADVSFKSLRIVLVDCM